MSDTKTITTIRMALINLESIARSIVSLHFLDGIPKTKSARADLLSLEAALAHSERLLKILYQRAAAHACKNQPDSTLTKP